MASDIIQHHTLLDQLDARQDELLCELDDLNQRIEALLREFGSQGNAPPCVDVSPLCPAPTACHNQ